MTIETVIQSTKTAQPWDLADAYMMVCSLIAGSAIGWSTVRMITEGGLG